MKKILGLLAMILIMGCDDGDMTFQSFDFSDSQVRNCGSEIIYKVNGSEALILELASASFTNAVTLPNTPRIVTISNTNRVTYLKYASDLGSNPSNIICNALPPVSPVEIWTASGGTIEITTAADTDNGVITGYTHSIFLRSVSFTRNGETIVIQNNNFGNHETNLGYTFDFTPTTLLLDDCNDNEVLYMVNNREVLRMTLNNNALFLNQAGTTSQPINDDNQIFFEIYNTNNLPNAVVCAEEQFNLTAKWKAIEGTIQVTTTSNGGGSFAHQIKLVNVKFQNIANPAETFVRAEHILGKPHITQP